MKVPEKTNVELVDLPLVACRLRVRWCQFVTLCFDPQHLRLVALLHHLVAYALDHLVQRYLYRSHVPHISTIPISILGRHPYLKSTRSFSWN